MGTEISKVSKYPPVGKCWLNVFLVNYSPVLGKHWETGWSPLNKSMYICPSALDIGGRDYCESVLKMASLWLILGVWIGGISGVVTKDISSAQVGVYHVAEAWYEASTTYVPIWLTQCIGLLCRIGMRCYLHLLWFFSPPSQAEV